MAFQVIDVTMFESEADAFSRNFLKIPILSHKTSIAKCVFVLQYHHPVFEKSPLEMQKLHRPFRN